MAVTDPIADMLTRIRNANSAMHPQVDIPASKLKLKIAKVLREEGFIKDYYFIRSGPQGIIRIFLKYAPNGEKVISKLTRISKPGLRIYKKYKNLPRVIGCMGLAILSTSKGVMTDSKARSMGVGGEILCYVW